MATPTQTQTSTSPTTCRVVETTTARKIRRVLDGIRRNGQFGYIFGPTGRGKTYIAKDWIRGNGNAALLRIRTGATTARIRRQLSAALLGHEDADFSEIVDYLAARPGFTLIIDEAAHLIRESNASSSANNLDYIRDLWDEVNETSSCGVCLIFTSCTIERLKHGRMAGFLEQFIGRMGNHLNIEDSISKSYEIKRALEAYGIDPAPELIDAAYTVATGGNGRMRALYRYLELAEKVNLQTGQAVTPAMLEKLRKQYESGIYPDE